VGSFESHPCALAWMSQRYWEGNSRLPERNNYSAILRGMNFLQQFAISQAGFFLSQLIGWYGRKYFSTDELAAVNVVINALMQLQQRIHQGGVTPQIAQMGLGVAGGVSTVDVDFTLLAQPAESA
jgi:hypothetical protein